jgi:predicted ester cyclase
MQEELLKACGVPQRGAGSSDPGIRKAMMQGAQLVERKKIFEALNVLAGSGAKKLESSLGSLFAPDAQWRGSHPLNAVAGTQAIARSVYGPLFDAFPDLERRDLIFVGGTYEGRDYIAAVGHYCGTWRRDWLTIPATGEPAYLRYGEVYEIRDGRIVQANALWDILDLIRQAGFWPIAPSLGREGMWPGPITGDGIVLHATDPVQSAASIAQTLAMHRTLGEYNDLSGAGRDGLLAMPQKEHWHEKMMWYGPSGIGTTRGLAGFVDGHQLPFRIAFPRPGGDIEAVNAERKRRGAGHYVRLGDGPFSVTGGWPSLYLVHAGGGFLGMGPTGRPITMRVMDFYLHHEGRIRENWVPLDILDVLMQMGVDVIGRMQGKFRRGQ